MSNWFGETIKLTGSHVKLVPLEVNHREALLEAASDGQLWELWYTAVPSPESIDNYIDTALKHKSAGLAFPFVVEDLNTKKIIGSTRYLNAEATHRRLEIGNTWYAKSYQRSGVNTECKLLLLTHAFETLQCIAVEFRTHWHNHRSRAAISRLGAKQDGVIRNHRITASGTLRDTVVFSIIQQEWPAVKESLRFELARPRD